MATRQQKLLELLGTLRRVSAVTDLDRLLSVILRSAKKTMEAEASSLILVDHAADDLYFHQIRGGRDSVKQIRLKVGEGIAGRVAKTARPMIVNDVRRSPYFFAAADRVTGFTTRQVLAVPLRVQSSVTGVLEAINKRSGRAFDRDDLKLFSAFAAQAAVAIENSRLYNLAAYDGLTRAFTRRYFDAWFAAELNRAVRSRRPLSVLLLDIDRFKKINDRYGHRGGDLVLTQLAQAVKSALGPDGTLARFGGEEFIVVLGAAEPRARAAAERIRRAVQRHRFAHEGAAISVSLSIGLSALRPGEPALPQRLIEQADQALYQAKRRRNAVAVFRA